MLHQTQESIQRGTSEFFIKWAAALLFCCKRKASGNGVTLYLLKVTEEKKNW